MKTLIAAALAAIASILSIHAFAAGDVPDGRTFVCDEGSNTSPTIQVVLPYNSNGKAYLMLESESMEMAPVPVASGFGYDIMLPAGHFLVTGKGNDVSLQVGDQPIKHCVANTPHASRSGDTGYLSQYGNFSLGGKVRMGPGTNYQQVGSLKYGTPIAIVRRTGVQMDGYEWFQIQWGNGNRAFQWGGIICSNSLHIIGVYEKCPADLN